MKNKVRLDIEALKLGHLVFEKDIEDGATVKDIFNELAVTHQEIVELAFDIQTQRLTGTMAVILNGSTIEALNGIETKLNNGDVIVVVPIAIGG